MVFAEVVVHAEEEAGVVVADDSQGAQFALQCHFIGKKIGDLYVGAAAVFCRDKIDLVVVPAADFDSVAGGEQVVANQGFELDADVLGAWAENGVSESMVGGIVFFMHFEHLLAAQVMLANAAENACVDEKLEVFQDRIYAASNVL